MPFGFRRRVLHNAGTGKQSHLIALHRAAADGHYPLTVAFGVTPADDAAKQAAIERLQLLDHLMRQRGRGTAQRRCRMQQAGQRQRIFSAAGGFTVDRRGQVPQRGGAQ
ncbi:hypothetical protein D3C80_1388110 [compost metagenome]